MNEIPDDIIIAAQRVEHYFLTKGATTWQLGGICSRNYALAMEDVNKWADTQLGLFAGLKKKLELMSNPNRKEKGKM